MKEEAMQQARLLMSEAAIIDFCHRHHIRRLALFGSVLRDDFSPTSDVDILVEFEVAHTPGLIAFVGMQYELSELLGRKADLNTPASIGRHFRDHVLSEAQDIYRAAS